MHLPGIIPLLAFLLPLVGVWVWRSYWVAAAGTLAFAVALLFPGMDRGFTVSHIPIKVLIYIAIYGFVLFAAVAWRKRSTLASMAKPRVQ